MSDNDDIYYGLGENDLLPHDSMEEEALLAGYDDAGYFSIVPVQLAEVEGERHIELAGDRTPFVNLTERQVREVQKRMDGDL